MSEHEPDRREELRLEIVRRQNELEDAILDLRTVVEGGLSRLDIRRRIVDAPLPWIAGGFVVGLMLGMGRR